MSALDRVALVGWLEQFRDAVHQQSAYLTELDSAIGDADHGTNMTRGMDAVQAAVRGSDENDLGALLKLVGMTLVSSVGGASGPLYGTFFLRAGATALGATAIDEAALGAALHAGVEGVVARGKTNARDKTMYDAMQPALDAYDAALAEGRSMTEAVSAAAAAAAAGRDATKPWVALKGRASYLGERSAGHIDPGAASTALLVQALADVLEGQT